MKQLFKTAILISIFYLSNLSAQEFSGMWSSDCSNTGKKGSILWISRATADGLYQLGYSRQQKSTTTTIRGDKDFKIINDDKLIYKNSAYTRCSKKEPLKYSPILEQQIKKYLQGEWKVKYQSRGGRKDNISNGRTGLPDLTFINDDQATISVKDKVRPIFYDVKDDDILLNMDEIQPLKVHLIDEKELHLSFELKPASGVFIYYKFGKGK
jgi:hypothetical protein